MTTEAAVHAEQNRNPGGLLYHNRWTDEARWRSVAREIAMDIFELQDILKNHGVEADEWERMSSSRGFTQMLREAIATWTSSLNVRERIEARTLSMLEGSLQELYRAMHDPEFSHNAKVELFKALSKNVGIGIKDAPGGGNLGERVSITINMGEGGPAVEVKDVTPEVTERPEVEFIINE